MIWRRNNKFCFDWCALGTPETCFIILYWIEMKWRCPYWNTKALFCNAWKTSKINGKNYIISLSNKIHFSEEFETQMRKLGNFIFLLWVCCIIFTSLTHMRMSFSWMWTIFYCVSCRFLCLLFFNHVNNLQIGFSQVCFNIKYYWNGRVQNQWEEDKTIEFEKIKVWNS